MARKKDIYSPCISVCTVEDDTGFCRGCFRSLQEISQWAALSDQTREAVLAELPARRERYAELSFNPYSS